MRLKVIFGDLKWLLMAFVKKLSHKKVIFSHPKCALVAILCKSKLKKLKLRIDLKWREMRSKVIFGHPKWPPDAIL